MLTNDDLARVVDTTDEWIVSHTGIRERHVAGEKETTSTLAVRAAREALLVADLAPAQIGLVIVATVTPEYPFPATASLVQDALGAANAGAFDLGAGCSGFIYALSMAADVIRAGSAQHVLVIGAETLSRIIDWTDRNTCVLFGDGAGAVVVSACAERCGVLASVLGSDGSGGELLIVPGGRQPPPREPRNGRQRQPLRQDERPRGVPLRHHDDAQGDAAGDGQGRLADRRPGADHPAPGQRAHHRLRHQAAGAAERPVLREPRPLRQHLGGLDPDRAVRGDRGGQGQAGDKLVLVGFGAGLTWAAAAVEWGMPAPTRPRPWLRRSWAGFLFWWAGVRSLVLRTERHAYNWVMGPVGKDDWRGKLRKRVDGYRSSVKQKVKGD